MSREVFHLRNRTARNAALRFLLYFENQKLIIFLFYLRHNKNARIGKLNFDAKFTDERLERKVWWVPRIAARAHNLSIHCAIIATRLVPWAPSPRNAHNCSRYLLSCANGLVRGSCESLCHIFIAWSDLHNTVITGKVIALRSSVCSWEVPNWNSSLSPMNES